MTRTLVRVPDGKSLQFAAILLQLGSRDSNRDLTAPKAGVLPLHHSPVHCSWYWSEGNSHAETRTWTTQRSTVCAMDDNQIHGHIEQLVAEEHQLWNRESSGPGHRRRPAAPRGAQGVAGPVLGPAAPAPGAARRGRQPRRRAGPPGERRRELPAVAGRTPRADGLVRPQRGRGRARGGADRASASTCSSSEWDQAQPRAEAQNAYLEESLVGGVRASGTSGSPRAPPTRPRPATPSSTATSGACTGWG